MNTNNIRYPGMEHIPILVNVVKDASRWLALMLAGIKPPDPGREESYGYRISVARVARSLRNSDEAWKVRRQIRSAYTVRLHHFN